MTAAIHGDRTRLSRAKTRDRRRSDASSWRGGHRLAAVTDTAREVARIGLGSRTREVEEGPNGSLWVLRDGDNGALVELTPR
jgi:glucose/arabinose dehydrogenase